jgi:hypothetical protein
LHSFLFFILTAQMTTKLYSCALYYLQNMSLRDISDISDISDIPEMFRVTQDSSTSQVGKCRPYIVAIGSQKPPMVVDRKTALAAVTCLEQVSIVYHYHILLCTQE